jgi:hypothetical protein
MTTYSKTPAPEGETPPSFGIGQFLFAVVLTVVLFLLVQSMVRHRFCQGRQINHFETQAPIPVGP